MPTLTLKNIPEDLYSCLKAAAEAHRRSLTNEILHCVEQVLRPKQIDVAEHLAAARLLRAKTAAAPLNDELLNAAKNAGRL